MNAEDLIELFSLVREDRADGEFYLGRASRSTAVFRALGTDSDWFCEPEFANYGYRQVWVCLRDRLTLTYTEGDLRLEVFKKDDTVGFYSRLAEAAKFYAEH